MNVYDYGGFWRRTIAYCIDKMILYLLSLILFIAAVALSHIFFSSGATDNMPAMFRKAFYLSFYATTIVLNMLYFTYFHGTVGQTPGKKMLGLKVIQTSGAPMTLGIAFLRWVGYLVSGIVFYLGFIWVGIDVRKQGWHDKIAGTYVTKIR